MELSKSKKILNHKPTIKSNIEKSRTRTRQFIFEAISSVCIRQMLLRLVLMWLFLLLALVTINPLAVEGNVATSLTNQNATKNVSYINFDYVRKENISTKEKKHFSIFEKIPAKSIILGKQKRRKINEKLQKSIKSTNKATESSNFEKIIFNYIRNTFKRSFYEPIPGIQIKLKDKRNRIVTSASAKTKRQMRSIERYTDGQISLDLPRAISSGRLLFVTGKFVDFI